MDPLTSLVTALAVGDSLTWGADGGTTASYRLELSRLWNRTGQPHTWKVAAMPGTTCHHWALNIAAAITLHHPDVIFLDCGTNDTGPAATETDYRTILATANTAGVQVIAAYIGIPDMRSPTNTIRPAIADTMHQTNLAIGRALTYHPGTPVADMQRIPADPEWLQADGIHLTARAEAAYGQLFYQAGAGSRGWKTFPQLGISEMCGLSGNWPGNPRLRPDIDYRVCRS